MREVAKSLNAVKDLYADFLGQLAPEIEPSWYAPFPPGIDAIRYAIEEVEVLRCFLTQVQTPEMHAAWIPRTDFYAGRDAVVIRVEIAAVGGEQLKVFVADGQCIVRGELSPLDLEFPHGTFERRYPLPLRADPEKLAAKYADGVLEVKIPLLGTPAPEELPDDLKAANQIHALVQLLYAGLACTPPWAAKVLGSISPVFN